MKNNNKAAEPMDPSAREGVSPAHVTRRERNAYALDVLIAEVDAVFGEVPASLGQPDEWQVIHEVTFDTQGDENLPEVLTLIAPDLRVESVDNNEGADVRVTFIPNRRTRDLRDGFGLAELLAVVLEDDVDDNGPPLDEEDEEFVGGDTGDFNADGSDATEPLPSAPEPEPEPEPASEPIYISKASGKRVTTAYGEANPDKVTVKE